MCIKIVKSILWITFIYLSSILYSNSFQVQAWNNLVTVLPSPINTILNVLGVVLGAIGVLGVLISFWLPNNKQTTLMKKKCK